MAGVTRALGGALVGAAVVLAGGCVWSVPLIEREFQVRERLDAVGPVDVESDNGSIDLAKGSAGEVVIDATVRARTQERADATTVTAQRDAGGTLVIRVRWPEGGRLNNEGCSMRVRIPGADGVRAATSNGDVTVADLGGPAELDTGNGKVEARNHAGPVRATTSNGRIVLAGVSGDIEARTSNGGVRIEGAAGAVAAETSNGDVEIELAPAGGGPVRVVTSNGSIDLAVGPSFAGRLRLDTSNGRVRTEGLAGAAVSSSGKNRAEVRVGEGGGESTLRTSNGSITVRGGR